MKFPVSISNHLGRRPCRAWTGGAAALLLALFASGCGMQSQRLDTEYGGRRGAGYTTSVSGTSVLAEMFENEGAKVFSWRHLSPKLDQADVIVWAPDSFEPPSPETRRWLEDWLRKREYRTLVYIGRDYDAASDYWRKVLPSMPANEAPEFARRQAQSQAEFQRARGSAPKKEEYARWFVIKPDEPPSEARSLSGPWSYDVDASGVEIPIRIRLQIPTEKDRPSGETMTPPDSQELLAADKDVLAYRLTHNYWNDGQIIVVSNGSFLLNLPLVNHEHRKLAGHLVGECSGAKRVAFLESGPDNPAIRDYDAGAEGGFAMLTVWPLNIILLHAAVLGMLYLAARFPIFGRPHELPLAVTGDFGKHVDALAQHLAHTGDAAFAQARIIFYQQTARRESGASHVKPQSAVTQHSAPAKHV